MAGFREFVTGEVLTAANVDDFLMKQSVQKYADAAARDAALGTAVAGGNALREGMVAWLDDTDSVIAYDGSAWNPVGGAGAVIQMVRATDSTTRTTSSPTFVDANLSVTITPTSADSKLLIIATCLLKSTTNSSSANNRVSVQITDSSDVPLEGAEDSFFGALRYAVTGANGQSMSGIQNVIGFDEPATTSPVTYKLRFREHGDALNATINNDVATGQMIALEVVL